MLCVRCDECCACVVSDECCACAFSDFSVLPYHGCEVLSRVREEELRTSDGAIAAGRQAGISEGRLMSFMSIMSIRASVRPPVCASALHDLHFLPFVRPSAPYDIHDHLSCAMYASPYVEGT